jgi:SAM-dependent methyltransferase
MTTLASSTPSTTVTSSPKPGLRGRARRGERPRPVRCQICRAETTPGLDLGHQPVSDLVLTRAQLNKPETFYPMQLHHCAECGLTQLGYVVNPNVVFKDFPFVSGTTQTATRHLQSLPKQLIEMMALDGDSFAVDIGSNDGTLLKGYQPAGVKFLGVDPAGDPVRIANELGLDTLHAFFDEDTADYIAANHGSADAITACGVFAHIADLAGVMKGTKKLLAEGGVFATDSQYWLDMVLRGHYDNMFHQHLRYYSMKPLIELHRRYGLEVFDVERSEVYGGSIRVFAGHEGDHAVSERVGELLAVEESARLYEEDTYTRFANAAHERRLELFSSVWELVSQGKKVIGLGGPAKAATVSNFCRLGPDLVEYVTEINPLRVGMFLPGAHIPIVDEEEMFLDQRPADAGILFAWNYYDEIVPKLRERGFEGQILLP